MIPLFPNRIRRRQPDLPPLDSATPPVSIVIVTYNTRGRYIERCLETIRALDYPDFEVLIVDNASSDETRPTLERVVRNEIVILNAANRGFAGGCNDGIRRARGRVCVMLNFDTEVDRLWLCELIKPFHGDPRLAITGSKMLFPGRELLQHAGGVIHGNGMAEHIGYREADDGRFDAPCKVDYVTGAGMAIRREVLDLTGGFDEDFHPAYCEEMDLCYRARLMSYGVRYIPTSVMVHHESPVLDNQSPVFQRLVYRNRMIFCLKNYRLREWLFDFLPYEIHWLRAPWSKGLRRMQIRAYRDALAYLVGRPWSSTIPPRRENAS